ncbi:MAG: ECF transporter S component [Peptococcaceae bacterium]|nr:ECF transporter S component [Candidatus Syntrophopropionicum ammoniitolerans]
MTGTNWGLYITIAGVFFVALLMLLMEKRAGLGARQVALIAILAAFCAAGRTVTGVALLFLQPTMFLVGITGFVFGARAGFFVGAMTPLISNLFIGMGPWTPWQMICWGLVGMSGAAVRFLFPRAGYKTMIIICFGWGFLYGAVMDLWHWCVFTRPLTFNGYFLIWAAGVSFDSLRAAGNLLFCAALGRQSIKILNYFHKKMDVRYLENL